MDPLSVVYEKRGNSGGAAYTGPSFTVGNNPLDQVAKQIGAERSYLQKIDLANTKLQQTEQKAALKKEADREKLNKGLLAKVSFEGMAADNKKYFTQLTIEHKKEGAKLKDAGYSLDDWSVPEVADWNTRGQKHLEAANASKEQGASLQRIANEVYGNRDKYDVKKSEANINNYLAMDPINRVGVDPNTLKVELEEPFNPYIPIKDIVPNNYSSLAKLRAQVELVAANAMNENHFKKGVDQRVWTDKKEYADALFNYLKPQWEPRQVSGSGSGRQEQLPPIEFSDQFITVHDSHLNSDVSSYAPNGVQIGNVNVVVTSANGIDAASGKKIDDSANVTSGVMSTPFVLKNGQVAPIPFDQNDPLKKYTVEIGGKLYQNKTYDEITSSLAASGKGEFKPMLYGQYKDVAGMDSFVWVPASSVVNGTGTELGTVKRYYNQQVVNSKELNKKYKQMGQQGQQQQQQGGGQGGQQQQQGQQQQGQQGGQQGGGNRQAFPAFDVWKAKPGNQGKTMADWKAAKKQFEQQ